VRLRAASVIGASVLWLCAVPPAHAVDRGSLEARPLWQVATGGIVNAPPLVSGDRVFVGSLDHRFYAIDRADGRVLWTYAARGAIGQVPAACSDSLVYFTASDSTLYALRRTDGRRAWAHSIGTAFADAFPPLVAGPRVFIGANDQTLRALDARTGRERWRMPLEGRPFGGLAARGELLFAATFEFSRPDGAAGGFVYALEAVSGRPRWRAELPPRDGLKGGAAAGVSLDDSLVFVGSNDGRVIALRQADGSRVWSRAMPGAVLTRCAVGGDVVFVGCLANRLVAMSASRGDSLWGFDTTGSIDLGPPSLEGDRIAFSASDSHVYVLDRKGVMELRLPGGFNPVLRDGVLYFGGFDDVGHTHSVQAVRLFPASR